MSRALILMYHAMDTPSTRDEAGYCVPPAAFREQMAWLATSGLQVLALDELVAALKGEAPPLKGDAVAVTFDDGLECFATHAFAVLTEYRLPATVFAVAGKIGQPADWTRAHGWPERRLMDATALCELQQAGITIGCHGLTHTRMTACDEGALHNETVQARQILREITGADVNLFAYPYGVGDAREQTAVREAGFTAAFSTRSGFAQAGDELYAMRRIEVSGNDDLKQFRRKIAFGANRVTRADLARYYAQRIYARLHG